MSKTTTLKGFILATAAAGFFASPAFTYAEDAAPLPGSAESKTQCQSMNSCKGRGDCKGENGCKGKNDCKGKGFLDLTMQECDALVVKMALDSANETSALSVAETAAPSGN